MSMLIGVAVGYELARQLTRRRLNKLMAVDIRFLGHSAVELKSGDTTVLVDPFITGNPKATVEASELEPTHIFLTHGHQDHYGDIVDIAKRTERDRGRADRDRRRDRRAGRRERLRPELRRHGHVRLGLGQAGARRPHVDDAQRHRHAARRAC